MALIRCSMRRGVVSNRRPVQRTISPAATTDSTALPWTSSTWQGAEADFALQDDRVLVLPGVQVRRHQGADRERMLHNRHRAAGVLVPELNTTPLELRLSALPSPVRRTVSGGGGLMPLPAVASRN